MKKTLLTLAIAVPLATGAFAFTDAPAGMVSQVERILDQEGFEDIDVNFLSDRQISAIFLIGTSGEDNNNRAQIEALFSNGTTANEDAMMVASVRRILDKNGFENISAQNLSDAQMAQIFLAGTSRDMASGRRAAIAAAIDPDAGSADVEDTTMYNQVRRILERNQIDVDIATLTDEQIAGIFLAANSADSESQKMQTINSILQ